MLLQLLPDAIGICVRKVSFIKSNYNRHSSISCMIDSFYSLGHYAVIGPHNKNNHVRN